MSENNSEPVYGFRKPQEGPCATKQDTSSRDAEDYRNDKFVHSFKSIQRDVNKNAHDKGWYESHLKDLLDGLPARTDAAWDKIQAAEHELNGLEDARRIALAHSEASEGLEGLRVGNPPSNHIPGFSAIEEEYADVIIRIMDHSHERGWRIAEAILAKAKFNANRPHKHGGKKF